MTTVLAPGQRSTPSAVVHGMHPLRGYPVTWHLTPLPCHTKGAQEFLVERADGNIDDDVVWQLAEKDVVVLTASQTCELVMRVTRPTH